MVEQPALQSAATDGNGPAKRRRRPALSCVECRMRKVKCDREKPCGACTRIKSSTCTFRPERARMRSQGKTSPDTTSASASGSHEHDHAGSARASPQPSGPTSEFDMMVNRYVAPGIFGEHGKTTLQPLSSQTRALNLGSHSDSANASVISSLLERINSLEGRLAATTMNDQPEDGTSPFREKSNTATGKFVKSKFYGHSHWMNAIEPYDALSDGTTSVHPKTNRTEINKSTELYSTIAEIKRMAQSIPPKEVCDLLVDCYLRTFEGVFRVLHVPSFRRDYETYWTGTAPAKPSIVFKILLVCAIGVPFYTGSNQPRLRASCAKWIQAASEWLTAPHGKSRLNMAGLQIQILILLARQICNVDGDFIWIPAGSLLRTAMHLGLHRDPSHFGKISVFHGEMRRRLWATVLEVTAQSSLDMGMPPMVSSNDYDTRAPSNINDADIGEGNDTPLEQKPLTVFTDSSIQIAFTETLPIRLEIIRLINNLRFDLSFDDVLRIGTELTTACRKTTTFLKAALTSKQNITPFQIKMSDTLIRRFVLCLHRPYFSKATSNPRYHYSRKTCLDTSLAIYAPATELALGEEDDWTRMTHRCVGFFKSFFLYAMSTVYYELNAQIAEQADSSLFAPLIPSPDTRSPRPVTLPAQFAPLRDVLDAARRTAVARIRNGETNAKGVAFLTCALARLDALVAGEDAEKAVLEAAKESVSQTSRIMMDVYRQEHGVEIDLNQSGGPFACRDHGRGEGVDDVSVQNGSNTNIDGNGDGDGAFGELPAFDGMDGFGLGALDDGGPGAMNMDIDFNSYLQGQSMGPEHEYHFGRSPEWWWSTSANWSAALNGFSAQ